MKNLLILLSFFLISSCALTNNSTDIKNVKVPEGHAYVQSKDKTDEVNEILSYVGVSHLEDVTMKLNTKQSNYFFFAAVVDYVKDEEGRFSIGAGDLRFVKNLHSCFIPEMVFEPITKDYVEELISADISVDKKSSKILNNDSLYIGVTRANYKALPDPMRLSSYRRHISNDKFYKLNWIVPLFTADVNVIENESKNIDSKMLVGFLNYDCKKDYDMDELFNSVEFSTFVYNPEYITEDSHFNNQYSFDINNFMKGDVLSEK